MKKIKIIFVALLAIFLVPSKYEGKDLIVYYVDASNVVSPYM